MTAIAYTHAVIASGGTESGAVALPEGYTLVAVRTPAALTGTALSFKDSNTYGGTYVTVTDGSSDVSVAMAASKEVGLDPVVHRTLGMRNVKLVSDSTEGAERVFTLVCALL